MSLKLPVNNFEWIEETSRFKEDFIKNYTEEIYEGYFLEVDIQYPPPKKIYNLIMTYHFTRTNETLKSRKACNYFT